MGAVAATSKSANGEDDEISYLTAFTSYCGYAVLILFGNLRDAYDKWTGSVHLNPKKGYAPIVKDFEDFFTRRLYTRIKDTFNRPICSSPGAKINVLERSSDNYNVTERLTGNYRTCINLGSYNYLGFGDSDSPCQKEVLSALQRYSTSTCSPRSEAGTSSLHDALEKFVARFVGKPAAIVMGMGFATNSTVIPTLIGKGGLIISDSCNHTSIVIGARLSGAKIKVFAHQNVAELERIIRESILEGQPRSHRPWTKILVMVEGIYSMEGEICDLPAIVNVVKRYNCYLYVDEAHSIGALGATGRGVCEYTGVNPDQVDILMGTFTKSFGGVGGYIAGSQELINFLRTACPGFTSSASVPPAVCQQIICSMRIIAGEDGTDKGAIRLASLRNNANYFREAMKSMGCHVLGDVNSPVVPVMICNPGKLAAFSRECLKRNLAVVVVGFPATSVILSRVRFCISAGHSMDDLREAIRQLDGICGRMHLKYRRYSLG